MRTGSKEQLKWGRRGARQASLFGAVCACSCFCSCMSVKYDVRKIEQPVTMNANPFACPREARPSLTAVGGYGATVSAFNSAVASPGPGPNQTQTQSTSAGSNEAQVKAFEQIGGDPSMTITGVRLDTESMGINLLLGMASGVKIAATGTVQRVNHADGVTKETVQ